MRVLTGVQPQPQPESESLVSEEDEEDDEEDEEEEDRYAAVSKALCGFDYTPAHSMEGLESTGTSGDG